MKRLVLLLLTLLSLLSFSKKVNIVILETSDLHGRLFSYDYAIDQLDKSAGIIKVATIVKEERAKNKNLILADNGDTVQDNSAELFNSENVHPMIQALNDLKYDFWTLGNHEFNFEKEFLERNVKGFKGTVLSANIIKDDGKTFVNPYVIRNIDGVRVAFIGMTPPHIPMWEASTPDHFAGLKFIEPADAINNTLKEIDGKYDILVGLFHLGRTDEKGGDGVHKLAEKFPQFDIIFGGHEHAVYVEKINGVTLIEPGSYGSNVAKGEITYDTVTKAKTVTARNIPTKDVAEDETLKKKYAYVDEKSKAYANEVVGEVTDVFIKNPDFITGAKEITTMPTAQLMETPVMELINEVQQHFAKSDVSSAALFNFGSNLEKGPFKRKDVAFIYKYTNTLMGVNITGENLLKYMEWSADYYNQLMPGDLTISFDENVRGYNYDMFYGIDYKIDVTKPKGKRIIDAKINGRPVDKKKVYKLAVNNYRFGTLLTLGLIKESDMYYDSYAELQDGGRVRDLIIKYITEEKNGKVTPSLQNNWKIVNYNFNNPLLEKLKEKVLSGEIKIPSSSDGRTLNVKSIKESEVK
jgi:2',3'-cyclic-nucleotide 2'-phosphodiesterase/3'-nucleotidase